MSHKPTQEKMTQPGLLNALLDAIKTSESWDINRASIWNLES